MCTHNCPLGTVKDIVDM